MENINKKIEEFYTKELFATPQEQIRILFDIVKMQQLKIEELYKWMVGLESDSPLIQNLLVPEDEISFTKSNLSAFGATEEEIVEFLSNKQNASEEIENIPEETDKWKAKKELIDLTLFANCVKTRPNGIYMNSSIADKFKEILLLGNVSMLKFGTTYSIGLYKEIYPMYADSSIPWNNMLIFDQSQNILLNLTELGFTSNDL